MKKAKKMTKVTKRILGAVMGMALLVGASDFGCLSVEASDMGQMGEVVQSIADDDGQEVMVLEATIIEDENAGISTYTMMSNCSITVGGNSEGMHIDIGTSSVGISSVIGVKNVKVQKKNWYGKWVTVATCSGAEVYNRSSIVVSILYPNAEKGETYRILCTHYANVDGYIEGDNDSGSFKYNFN